MNKAGTADIVSQPNHKQNSEVKFASIAMRPIPGWPGLFARLTRIMNNFKKASEHGR